MLRSGDIATDVRAGLAAAVAAVVSLAAAGLAPGVTAAVLRVGSGACCSSRSGDVRRSSTVAGAALVPFTAVARKGAGGSTVTSGVRGTSHFLERLEPAKDNMRERAKHANDN